MNLASIPSPDQGSWQIGFFELRAYALCIIAGVLVAVWLGDRRWVARGGRPGTVADIAVWAVPFGLVGARLYHVVTDWQLYFGAGRNPVEALYIWRGGLGIWGAVALGALGAYIGCRRRNVKFLAFGDAIMPAIAVGQAVGRFGNWFNQELFGRPTDLPWALQIDPEFRPPGFAQFDTFHPTFLYEALWDLGLAGVLVWLDRRFHLGHGRVVALYVMGYTAGRGWIEMLRIDEANEILGLRLNVWTSMVLFLAGLAFLVWSARKRPGREVDVEPAPAAAVAAAETAPGTPGSAATRPGEATPGERTAAETHAGERTAGETRAGETAYAGPSPPASDAGADDAATSEGSATPSGSARSATSEPAGGRSRRWRLRRRS